MAYNNDCLRLCSFNCRSIKSSITEINHLCDMHDIVFLQEHWLLPHELNLLANLHDDFFGVGFSAVDTSIGMLVGRPFGGTAILYRKSLATIIKIVNTSSWRITALLLHSQVGPVLCCNIYMPTDYGTTDCLDEYMDMCSKISVLYADNDAAFLLVAGDFNCDVNSRFYYMFSQFCHDNQLICSDYARLIDAVTYCSDDGLRQSWIDHVVCSAPVDRLIYSLTVADDIISSDHKPVSVVFSDLIPRNKTCLQFTVHKPPDTVVNWAKADNIHISMYQQRLDEYLRCVYLPEYMVRFDSHNCMDNIHHDMLNDYYTHITDAIYHAIDDTMPRATHLTCNKHNVPGWNDLVQEKHDLARQSYLEWVRSGRPHDNVLLPRMRRTRAAFKLALRYCRAHEEQLRADAYAANLDANDSKKFWKQVQKDGCNKVKKFAVSVNGAVGDDNIAAMWKTHFESVYSSVNSSYHRQLFESRINALVPGTYTKISMDDIIEILPKLKHNKATGPDRIAAEAFIYGTPRLFAHLSIMFSWFLKFGVLPAKFTQSTIVPLVKVKCGDLSDVENYRAIMISNAITKVFEFVLFDKLTSSSYVDEYQFGFKAKHSTGLCTNVLKRTIDYYTERGSYVFCSFVDFSKAFDRVNYWKLFNKLLDDNVAYDVVKLLSFWYSNQSVSVRWQNTQSESFGIQNGTRQGSVLSPFLFTRYIREVLSGIINSNIGCNIGGCMVNILAYADDLVLLAPSWRALQQLLDKLQVTAGDIDMCCNSKKTVCMIFSPKCRSKIVAYQFPNFTINNEQLSFVNEFKYLGHIINNSQLDDADIYRERRNLFYRCNMLARRFYSCSVAVKLRLFKSFCLCFCDAALWNNFTAGWRRGVVVGALVAINAVTPRRVRLVLRWVTAVCGQVNHLGM